MEKTYLSEIYDFFLSSISDYTILESLPQQIEEDLFTYFKKARSKFHKCKNSLNVLDDDDGEKYFGNEIYHIVKRNETLSGIAKKYKMDIDELANNNNMSILDDPNVGDKLFIRIEDTLLSDYEIDIISNLMLVEYIKPQYLSSEVIKQSLSDKDFKIHSQANQLREIGLLYRNLRKEARKMITEYTYMGMTDNDKK